MAGLLQVLRKTGHRHQRLETDDYSDSDYESDLEDQLPIEGSPVRVRRLPLAKAVLPQDITFTVPEASDSQGGQDIVCIQGPHGPIRIPLPDGAKPGEQCTYRLGPPALGYTKVPEGAQPGDTVKFEGEDGEPLNAVVPDGKKPGDEFEVSLPVLLIQVPMGATAGMEVMYEAVEGHTIGGRATVPPGASPGSYFQVLVVAPGQNMLVADTTWPQELKFCAPEDWQPGQHVCVQGPHGPLMVPLPEGAKPGEQYAVKIGPENDDGYEVVVPEDALPGDTVPFQGTNGESLHAVVPPQLKPGEKFTVGKPTIMVRVPAGAQSGTKVMFQIPGEGKVRFAKVPSDFKEGAYFPVVLPPPPELQKPTSKEAVGEDA
jgi:hypothetical protein